MLRPVLYCRPSNGEIAVALAKSRPLVRKRYVCAVTLTTGLSPSLPVLSAVPMSAELSPSPAASTAP